MKRGGRDLETETHEQQTSADDEHRPQIRLRRDPLRDIDQTRAAGGTVDQRDAIQEEAGRNRSQNEVLHRRFSAARTAPIHAGQHVNREGHQFDAEEDEHQIPCGREHHHAGGREQHQHRDLRTERRAAMVFGVEKDEREHRTEQDHEIDRPPEPITGYAQVRRAVHAIAPRDHHDEADQQAQHDAEAG